MVDSFTGYGGIGVIGGNQFFIRSKDTTIMLDYGMPFSSPYFTGQFGDEPRKTHGARDFLQYKIIPKVEGALRSDFAKSEGIKVFPEPTVQALWLSHAHQDHYSGIPFSHEQTVIYSTPQTKQIIEILQEAQEIEPITYWKRWPEPKSFVKSAPGFTTAPTGKRFVIFGKPLPLLEAKSETRPWITQGDLQVDNFQVKDYYTDHIRGSAGALIITPNTRIGYTGDFRDHGPAGYLTPKFAENLRNADCEYLIIEGTKINNENNKSRSQSEAELLLKKRLAQPVESGWRIVMQSMLDYQASEFIKSAMESNGLQPLVSPEHAYILMHMEDLIPGISKGVGVWARMRQELYPDATALEPWKRDYFVVDEFDSAPWKRKVAQKFDIYHDAEVVDNRKELGIIITRKPRDRGKFVDWKTYRAQFTDTTSEYWGEETSLSESKFSKLLNFWEMSYEWIHSSAHAHADRLLAFIDQVQPKVVIIIHTENPKRYREMILNYRYTISKGPPVVLTPKYGKTYDLVPTPKISQKPLPEIDIYAAWQTTLTQKPAAKISEQPKAESEMDIFDLYYQEISKKSRRTPRTQKLEKWFGVENQ